MIKILIVDDEYLIRDLIKDSLDYEQLGFEVTGEAEDGRDALEKIERLTPQVIIMDINIPYINGIELSKIIRDKYPDIKIVILTGYSEFEYAKECIKIGVSDYLLKPIQSDELKKILLEIKKEFDAEAKRKQYMDILEDENKKARDTLTEQFLNQLIIENSFSASYIKEQFQKCEISLSEISLIVICIQIDNIATKWEKEEERRLWRFAVHNISNEILGELNSGILFFGPERLIVYVGNYHEKLKDTLSKIIQIIKELLNFSVSTGIGRVYDGFENIKKSYTEAYRALSEKFYEGNGRIIEYNQAVLEYKELIPITFKDVAILLRSGERQVYIDYIENIKDDILKQRPIIRNVYKIYEDISADLIKYLSENSINPEESDLQYEYGIEFILQQETIFELHSWLLKLFDKAFDIVNSQRLTRTASIVGKARIYIEENCHKQDISLEEISERIFINPSYLSKVFKRETKYSVIEYLTNYRMKKAKKLMDENPDMQISFIAGKVGYSDPFYFSKLFKKFFGISPSKYMSKK